MKAWPFYSTQIRVSLHPSEEILNYAQWIFIENLRNSLNKLIYLQIWFIMHLREECFKSVNFY